MVKLALLIAIQKRLGIITRPIRAGRFGFNFFIQPHDGINDVAFRELYAEVGWQLINQIFGIPNRPIGIIAVGGLKCLVMNFARLPK